MPAPRNPYPLQQDNEGVHILPHHAPVQFKDMRGPYQPPENTFGPVIEYFQKERDRKTADANKQLAAAMKILAANPPVQPSTTVAGPSSATGQITTENLPAPGTPIPDLGSIPWDRYKKFVSQSEGDGSYNQTNLMGSGATGKYQAMPATMAGYGYTPEQFQKPEAQEEFFKKFTTDNYGDLTKKLGRPPTPQELYLAHWFGATGSTQMIDRPPMRMMDTIYSPKIIEQNRLQGKSVGDVLNTLNKRWGSVQ